MNWGLLEDKRRMVFKIPIGKTSPEEARKILMKFKEQYNTNIDMSVIVRWERRLKLDKINRKINGNNCNKS